MTIDELSGIFDHTSKCEDLVDMDGNPPISPHLLRRHTNLGQFRADIHEFAFNHWGLLAGDQHYRFTLNPRESSCFYRTLRNEVGIHQDSAAETNLDLWFQGIDPQVPSCVSPRSLFKDSCVHY